MRKQAILALVLAYLAAPAMAADAIVVAPQAGDILASKFKGTDVIGPDGEKLGDVMDVLFNKDGSVKAYVVAFGGFLGIGAKEIALSASSFEHARSSRGYPALRVDLTRDQIKRAPTFDSSKIK